MEIVWKMIRFSLEIPELGKFEPCDGDRILQYDEDNYIIGHLFADMCEALEKCLEGLKFKVSGLGNDDWGANIYDDLALFLEDCSEYVSSRPADRYPGFTFQFVEQGSGLSCSMQFTAVDQYNLQAVVEPMPDSDILSRINKSNCLQKRKVLEEDIALACGHFVDMAEKYVPKMASHKLFLQFKAQLEKL